MRFSKSLRKCAKFSTIDKVADGGIEKQLWLHGFPLCLPFLPDTVRHTDIVVLLLQPAFSVTLDIYMTLVCSILLSELSLVKLL